MKRADDVPGFSIGPLRAAGALLLLVALQGYLGWRFELVRQAFGMATAPVRYPFQMAQGWTGWIRDHLESVERLEAKLAETTSRASELELRASLADQAIREAERLREALSARDALGVGMAGRPRFARVIGHSPHPGDWRITLDLGSEDGIGVDFPVLYGEDVLGRVIEVHPHSCRVLLIQDPASALGVLVDRDRSPGVALGTGSRHLALTSLPAGTVLQEGDRILTGSLSAYYPKGLLVGRVRLLPGGKAVVEPHRDPLRLEEAFVLPVTTRPRLGGNLPPG